MQSKGFGELVTVAFFSLLLLLGLGAITRRENENQRRTFSGLGVGLLGLVIVMLIAAFQRLGLYEAAYGFSRLRTYTHVFMIWLGLLLVAVVILEVLRRERVIGLGMVLASLGFVISLSVLNVDAFIVKQNIQREIRSTTDKPLPRVAPTWMLNTFWIFLRMRFRLWSARFIRNPCPFRSEKKLVRLWLVNNMNANRIRVLIPGNPSTSHAGMLI